ncbi:hypothetical protein C4J81_17240 [Deltaproteobacteria bacterium Smac51]|nr:hypothetical protein C4J81_17240 [Deltaproteobacteria bacterium Smac51]
MLTIERLHEIKGLCQRGREGLPVTFTAEHMDDLVKALEDLAITVVIVTAENKDMRERLKLR